MGEKTAWHKSWSIGLGASIIAAIVQVVSAVWPESIKPHPWLVTAFFVIAIFCILFPVVRAVYSWATRFNRVEEIPSSPLEIIFEPLNPARKFWSLEAKQDFYKRAAVPYWEYRLEIKNNSQKTLRNVAVTVERIGAIPEKPYRAVFVRPDADSCDIQPGCSELAAVIRWPHPKVQIGMLAGPSAWGYGPLIVIASADDVPPAKRRFEFNYETERMLFHDEAY
jgi:hypothetical protein